MAGVSTICEECEGKRFQASVLEYHLGGKDISGCCHVRDRGGEFFCVGSPAPRLPTESSNAWPMSVSAT